MRSLKFAVALIVGSFATSAFAQETLDWPVGELQEYHLDSGVQNNPAIKAQTVFLDVVVIQDAAWLRIYFAEVQLEAKSFVRITSLLDQEVQELDADGLAMWNNSSAYFNGNALLIELVAAPGTTKNRFVIEQVAVELQVALPVGGCGICGPDDRVPSTEEWAARLFPAGCTASVWNTESCLVSAGHCFGANMVIQFRVPNSTAQCNTLNPPIAEQFPITSSQSVNGGVGNDWMVMTSGTNNLGQTAYERYGEFRPIASAPPGVGNALDVWGYGIDSECTLSQTQQTDNGSVTQVFNSYFRYNVDITFGNSGSAVIRNGEILGIVTHCPCPGFATRVDHSNFTAARESLCPEDNAVEAPLTGVSVRKGVLLSGNLGSLVDSDNDYIEIEPVLNNSGTRFITKTIINAQSPEATVAQLDLTIETGIDTSGVKVKVRLRNWDTNRWDQIDSFVQPQSDTEKIYLSIPNPNAYIRNNNSRKIRVMLQTTVKVVNAPDGYVFRIDHVQLDITP